MRWWNKLRGALRRVAMCSKGGVRAPWKLIAACAAYLAWAWAAAYLLSAGFAALFSAWNLSGATYAQAPAWARWLYENYGRIISLITSAGTVALSYLLLRLFARARFERLCARDFGVGALVGAAMVGLGAGAFLLLDAMRLYERGFFLHADMLWMLPVYLAAALAEERFARTLTMRVATLRARPVWGYVSTALVFTAITGSYSLGALGLVNMLLTCAACARWSATGRGAASVGMRFAWSYAANALIAFPGGETGAQAGARLYDVSDAWLTGGAKGLICGAWMTLALVCVCLVLYREVLRVAWKTLRKRRGASPRQRRKSAQ